MASKFNGAPSHFMDWHEAIRIKFNAAGCLHHVEALVSRPLESACPILPAAPLANAPETIHSRYRHQYSEAQKNQRTWRLEDQEGMKILDSECTESIKQNFFRTRNTLFEQFSILKSTFLPAAGAVSMIPDSTALLWKKKIKDGYQFNGGDTLRTFIMTTRDHLTRLNQLNAASSNHDLFEKIEDQIRPKDEILLVDQIQVKDCHRPHFFPLYSVFKTFKDSHSGSLDEAFYGRLIEKLCIEDEDMRSRNMYPSAINSNNIKSNENSNVLAIRQIYPKSDVICSYCLINGHSTEDCRKRKCCFCNGTNHVAIKCFKRNKFMGNNGGNRNNNNKFNNLKKRDNSKFNNNQKGNDLKNNGNNKRKKEKGAADDNGSKKPKTGDANTDK